MHGSNGRETAHLLVCRHERIEIDVGDGIAVGREEGITLDVRERDELDRLRMLVDDLKQTAWDHRELDSALSTIVIDKIRAHERRGRPELGG